MFASFRCHAVLIALLLAGGSAPSVAESARRTVLATGDLVPDGTVIAEQGLSWSPNAHCLAADGRVAAVATLTSGHEALLCVDADGPHLVAQSGTIAPDGYAFTDFANCRFTGDGALIFSGSRGVPKPYSALVSEASVYRAGPNGIERLFGDFDPLGNGTSIEDHGSNVDFVANARGSVLARASAGGQGLFLRHAGRLDVVSYVNPLQWGLADNDDVVTIERVGEWRPPDHPSSDKPAGNVVLVWNGDRVRVITFVESAPPTAFRGFTNLTVRGDLVLFTKLGGQDQSDRSFFYRLGDAAPREIPAAVASGGILDFTPAGRILRHITGAYEVLSPDGTSESLVPAGREVTPFGINDRGNLALYSYANPPDSRRQTIELVGPAPDGSVRCPLAVTPPANTPRSDTTTPTPTATPVVGVGPYRAYVSDAVRDRLMVIDTATQELLGSVSVSHRPTGVAASPDGRRVFVLADAKVDVIDAVTLQVIHTVSLGEGGVGIVAAPDNVTAFVSTWVSTTGEPRTLIVDGDIGLATSIVTPFGQFFGLSSDGTRLFGTSTRGAPCDSTGQLVETDLYTSAIIRSTDMGRALTAAAVSPDGSRVYVADGCSNQLLVVDLATFAVVGTLTDQSPDDLAVTADGRRAYTTHSYSSYYTNPDGSYTTPQGYLSAVDLAAGTFERISVAGGRTVHVAVTPDGRLVYVTMDGALPGSVAVVDAETNTQLTSILPGGSASDVAVAPVPDSHLASPTPRRPPAIIRAEDVSGVVGDDVRVVVGMDSGGLDVTSVEHDLVTTWNSPLLAMRSNVPDCRLAPGVAAVASFEFDRFCAATCDRVHVRIQAAEPGASLPRNGILYTCTANISYPYQPWLHPILVSRATAADAAGEPLPVFGADSELRVLSRDDATPRPTRTRPPTATSTVTGIPTPTPLPVMIEIGAATVAPGSRATIPVVLRTNGASVVGVQNDISFTGIAPIGAAPTGKPECAVNPAIDKPNTSFVFMPVGCDHARGECAAVRAIVLSLDDVIPVADQSVLYTCLVEVPLAAPVGTFSLRASAVHVSDPSGRLLPATAVDGSVSVRAAPTSEPSVTPLPVMIEIGSATIPAGSQATVPVVLHTNGASVVGVQNEIAFSGSALIGVTATGKPQCAVNPTIVKPNTSFAFVPPGCDYGQGACTGVRAIVLSIDDVNPIADQSVLYTCVIEVPPTASAGTFSLHASAVYVSDPSGQSLSAVAVDGSVAISAAPTSKPSSTATPTPTSKVDVTDGTGHPASGVGASPLATGGGCNIAPQSTGSGSALAAGGLLALVFRSRGRVRQSRR